MSHFVNQENEKKAFFCVFLWLFSLFSFFENWGYKSDHRRWLNWDLVWLLITRLNSKNFWNCQKTKKRQVIIIFHYFFFFLLMFVWFKIEKRKKEKEIIKVTKQLKEDNLQKTFFVIFYLNCFVRSNNAANRHEHRQNDQESIVKCWKPKQLHWLSFTHPVLFFFF